MAILSTVYCTEAEMNLFLSANAVIDFADHDDDGSADTDVVEDAINQATETIDFYLRQRHTQAQLATSNLVNRWCTVLACRFLTQRRANGVPDSIQAEWEQEVKPMLQEVRKGLEGIPGLALREDLRPTMSNLTVDRRYQRSTVRVTKPNSSNPPTKLTQDSVREVPRVFN